MSKLRLGVIGAGSWAVASHLPNLARHRGDVDFVAVNRLGAEALQRIRASYGFAIASEDYHDVIRAGIDICVISSPSAFHYEHARAALEAGAHVLIEKPVTIQPEHAWDLVQVARRLERHVVVAFGYNYKPMMRRARELMCDGAGIGAIENLSVRMASVTRELLSNAGAYPAAAQDSIPESGTWTNPSLSGGGYGQAQLSHALGLALWLTGLRGREAFAFTSAPLSAPVELHDAMAIRYDNGAIGTVSGGASHLGAAGNKDALDVRAIGSEGQFALDVERELVWRYRGPGDDIRIEMERGSAFYDCVGPVDALVDLALGRSVENCSPIELGARTVEILDALYRSARSGAVERIQNAPQTVYSSA
jgi:predicted dehydrogenase